MKVLPCLVLLVAAVMIGAQAKSGKRRLGGKPKWTSRKPVGQTTSWQRTVDGTDVTQKGFANDKVIRVYTKGQNLTSGRLSSSVVLYDFSGSSPLSVVGRGAWCYLIPVPAGETHNSTVAQLTGRSGTTVTAALQSDQRDALAAPLNGSQVRALFTSNPAVRRVCARSLIVDTSPADPATFPTAGSLPAGQEVISVLTLDSKVSLLVNASKGAKPQRKPARKTQRKPSRKTQRKTARKPLRKPARKPQRTAGGAQQGNPQQAWVQISAQG